MRQFCICPLTENAVILETIVGSHANRDAMIRLRRHGKTQKRRPLKNTDQHGSTRINTDDDFIEVIRVHLCSSVAKILRFFRVSAWLNYPCSSAASLERPP